MQSKDFLTYNDIVCEAFELPHEKISRQGLKVSFPVMQPKDFLMHDDIVCEAFELPHEKLSRQGQRYLFRNVDLIPLVKDSAIFPRYKISISNLNLFQRNDCLEKRS